MNKTKRTVAMLSILSIALLGACHDPSDTAGPNTGTSNTSNNNSTVVDEGDFYVTYKGQELANGDSIEVVIGDKVTILVPKMDDGSSPEFTFTSSDTNVVRVGQTTGLLTGVAAGSATVTVNKSSDASDKVTFNVTVIESSTATGAFTYSAESYEEKANILASLEKYAVDNYLTGITMFSNGSQVVYNGRYVPTPSAYITGYGWGTMREGNLTGDIANPLDGNNASYYQVATTSLPSHVNSMNASGSDVSSIAEYFSTAYFGTRLNQTADGYEWYSVLSNDERPVPIDDAGNPITTGLSTLTNTRWRIHVKTGKDGLVYRTASTKSKNNRSLASFDGREVQLEDYLTPLKFMLTCYNNQYRGAELTTGVSGFARQAANYYGSTISRSGSTYSYYDEAKWEECNMDDCIKVGTDSDGDYIEFNLLQPCTQFYAMYYLSSNLYSPLPAEFIELWQPSELGKSPDGYSPVDTFLYTGPYYITEWSANRITFENNSQYFYKQDRFKDGNVRSVYNLPGFQYNQVEEATVSKQHFLNGSIDSYVPNKDDLADGGTFSATSGSLNNSQGTWRKYETAGDSNFKLNVNATTTEQWQERFGTTGTIYAHDSNLINSNPAYLKSRDYMSNIHFLNFLSYGMDRKTICESRGMKPTQEYFSDNYLIDPENGVSYNSTDAHKAVLADRYNSTYGYNRTAAENELEQALSDFEDQDIQFEMNSSRQKVINIDMEWMNTSDKKDYGDVFDSIKLIFNDVVSESFSNSFVLQINDNTGSSDYNAVYDKMKRGEYDLGFGAISGGDLDPINFMEVLKSDNSSGFTLNWGPDTSKINSDDQGDVVYDGKKWSYDGLWNAANTGVLLKSDNSGDIANAENVSSWQTVNGERHQFESKNDSAKSVTYKLSFNELIIAGAKSISLSITNSQATMIWELADMGATSSNDYVGTITLDSSFNSYEEFDRLTNGMIVVTSPTATGTVYYQVEINGVTRNFTSTFTISTYVGIVPED